MMTKRRNRVYLSCYSCNHSDIIVTANGKIVHCKLSNRLAKLTYGMTIPTWCEIRERSRAK